MSFWDKEVDSEALCMVCDMTPDRGNVEAVKKHLEEAVPLTSIIFGASSSSSPPSPPQTAKKEKVPTADKGTSRSVSPTTSPSARSAAPPLPDASTIQALALKGAEVQRQEHGVLLPPPPVRGGSGYLPKFFTASSSLSSKVSSTALSNGGYNPTPTGIPEEMLGPM
eukprot:PhM_4_TR3792/c0_g1_i2/m.48258